MLCFAIFISRAWKCGVDGGSGHLWEQATQKSVNTLRVKLLETKEEIRDCWSIFPSIFLCFCDFTCTEIIIISWVCILFLSCFEFHAAFSCLIDTEFNACWIISQVFLSSKWHGDLTASFARGVSFFFEVITSIQETWQGREEELQTREARLHRIHSKADKWTQISWIPREYLMWMTILLIMGAGQAVMSHWWASHQQLPSSLFLKLS